MSILILVFVNYAHFNKKMQKLSFYYKWQTNTGECVIHFLTTLECQTIYNTRGRHLGQLT